MNQSTHPPTRRCKSCGEVKPIDEFHRASKVTKPTHDPYRKKCRDCLSAYLAEYTRERREFLTAYKLKRGCMDCGWREHVAALEFDHRPGEVKLFPPNTLKTAGTWQQMLDEIAKCDVVCANCHRIRTHSRPPANRKYDLKRAEIVARPIFDDPDQLALIPPDVA